ncbi:photosystem II D1 precursor processing protein PSB27-H2, chloroplastic [Physcomitrium patens]|uniref:Uncharacterized protein n=1 Tax=Physcomitrium patens TaxID=3218 RepID=A0A2K1K7T2_PHYPA|nr:photosystem II D1 precursor processing protein PSB27-H2, chloroplastic-like [Physcomitrium patens]PNR49838.1 hypothetical protein PHYPA_011734 [Physcomitrium patens]|eukprot:XP_024382867.1 photosystem II D1 precursor processing protein PSB27-H2, chloroplastic-like [Physcomitrella patens]
MALQSLDIAVFSIPAASRGTQSLLRSRAPCGSIRCISRQQSNAFVSISGQESETASEAAETSRSGMISRRHGISSALLCASSIMLGQMLNYTGPALAEENAKKEEGGNVVDAVLELFDPDQLTKSGKKLPKKYVKSVREVVKNLRESFTQDSNDGAKFRRNADSAKEAIREYLQNWRGSKVVETEDSYLALERAFLELGKFYSSKGPQAPLPEDIKNRVLEDLNKADESI